MELRHDNHDECLQLLQRAVAPPPRRVAYHDQGETVQMRLHKSLKVSYFIWSSTVWAWLPSGHFNAIFGKNIIGGKGPTCHTGISVLGSLRAALTR